MLHNFLITRKDRNYCPPGFQDSEDEQGNFTLGVCRSLVNDTEICDIKGDKSTKPSTVEAREICDALKEYFLQMVLFHFSGS